MAILIAFFSSSCNSYLDVKPDKSLAVPSTLEDFQALINNSAVMNQGYPVAPEIASDNFYMTYDNWLKRDVTTRNIYIWERDVFNESASNDWYTPYSVVFYANVILEGLKKMNGETVNQSLINEIKGQALFFRAFAFQQLALVFTKAYDPETASSDLGLVLSLSSDVTGKSSRASLKETYDQIIKDAQEAAILLPISSTIKTLPSKPAALALLARTFLVMHDYEQAGKYADSCLTFQNQLLNFKSLDRSSSKPFPLFNEEVIFHSSSRTATGLTTTTSIVDSSLYKMYREDDLRKALFFKLNADKKTYAFYGNYAGNSSTLPFNGLATDEMYLIRAEANARAGKTTAALSDLNVLLSTRYTADFQPVSASSADEALIIILNERRKELLYRGLRWSDLKRLNMEGQFVTTLERVLGGQRYTLPPNDSRYVIHIPENVISISGILQN